MNAKSTVLTACICILILQLSTINVRVAVPAFSYGDFAVKQIEKVKKVFSYTPRSVQYVSSQQSAESLIFVGDVLLARNIEYLMSRHGADYPYQGIQFSSFGENPAVVGNFESAIPYTHVPTPTNMIRFSVNADYLPALRKAGFSYLSLANNHSLDFGTEEFDHTTTVLENNGLRPFGHQRDLSEQSVEFAEINGTMVAIIAIHTLHTLPTYSDLQAIFSYAEPRSDYQIVYVHWGDEYVPVHNARQREAAERFVDAGADLVIGHHPHVVQDIERIHGVPVFYSLGNYIFDQYDSVATKQGLLLHLDFTEENIISLVPVTSENSLSQPTMMSPANHARFLADLAKRSDKNLSAEISAGKVLLSPSVASSTKTAIMNG